MTNSSLEPRVLRDASEETVTVAGLGGDLRTGRWTRLGGTGVLGDATTEQSLDGLAERSRRAAQAQGYARGWTEGRRAGEARARAEAEEAAQQRAAAESLQVEHERIRLQALDAAATVVRDRLAEACAAVESHVVEAALEIAEMVIGRELALAPDPGADAVRRVLSVMPADLPAFTLRLNPADYAGLDTDTLAGRTVTVVTDAAVARGDAVAETETMVIDASVGAAIARVREVLAP
jgi:flagellar assembly protein FliH